MQSSHHQPEDLEGGSAIPGSALLGSTQTNAQTVNPNFRLVCSTCLAVSYSVGVAAIIALVVRITSQVDLKYVFSTEGGFVMTDMNASHSL